MTKIKPKLYLNMSPQTQEEGSLAFARNMKVDDDGNLVSDYGYKNIDCNVSNDVSPAVGLNTYNIVGHIVGLDNKIYFFCATLSSTTWTNSKIIEYDEVANTAKKLTTNWTYSGGEITGYVSTNQSGEKILTIGEYKDDVLIPLKHINLSYAKPENSNESLYCQAPKVPITNLVLDKTYVKTIPNGVYVFFIRYKIRKDVYTPWYLCSAPIFAGTSDKISTLQGGLKYINHHKDSAKSFVFTVNHIIDDNKSCYSEFQIGFIITHDESTNARIWKSFDMSTTAIYFDYENVQEANIDDLLATTYELYNVRNITSFKNKLYISNYKETDFNKDSSLESIVKHNIFITVKDTRAFTNLSTYKQLTIQASQNNIVEDFDYTTNRYNLPTGKNFAYVVGDDFSSFDTSVSKLAKIETREKQNIVQFDIGWKANYNPDLCFVYNVYNNVYNKEIFGENYEKDYEDVKSCIIVNAGESGNGIWWYDNSTNIHPFYNKNLTFIYSDIRNIGISIDKAYCRNDVFFFNKNSKLHATNKNLWPAKDRGFDNFERSAIDNNIIKEITSYNSEEIAYVEVSYGAKVYKITHKVQRSEQELTAFLNRVDLDNYTSYYSNNQDTVTLGSKYFTLGELSKGAKDKILSFLHGTLNEYTVGFSENLDPIIDISDVTGDDDAIFPVSAATVIIKKFEFTVDTEDLEVDNDNYFKRFKASLKTTDYACVCSFSLKSSVYTVNNNDEFSTQKPSLMPLSKYNFYIHFVDDKNIITNGIKIGTSASDFKTGNYIFNIPFKENFDSIKSLQYKVKWSERYPLDTTKYKAFFISLVNVGDIVAECFGYIKKGTTNIVNCLEADTLLYSINDNISIYVVTSSIVNGTTTKVATLITEKAKYYSSGSSNPALAFGNCGYIAWNDSDKKQDAPNGPYNNTTLYAVIQRNTTSEENQRLIKASAYIPLAVTRNENNNDVYCDVPGEYYGSYFCSIKKPDFNLSSNSYVAGGDVYNANRDTTLKLDDFKSYIQLQTSPTYFVTSNFNLNYLSLTEDIVDKIFNVGSASSGIKQVVKVINSATLSYIYELKSMYKDFMNKTFKPVDTDYKTDFENTIKVSNVLSDETFNNSVFRFDAKDYYNIPTDRGIIVNLFSIGNNIFVHTKGSLYKFDANQTISASDKDITLQESEPFDLGISQIFDSQYGYGGIDNKEAGCITFDSYLFYDRFSNHIFAYSGNGQVQVIDGSINKLLNYYKFTECYTLHDENNHRVLFGFKNANNKLICISYNYKAKAFISIHDIRLEKSFSTRKKCYSYRTNICELFNNNVISTEYYNDPLHILNLYGGATALSGIFFGTDDYYLPSSCFNIAVVLPTYENIREVINNIKYIGNIIKTYINTKTIPLTIEQEAPSIGYDLICNKEHTSYNSSGIPENPVESMYVITDSCVSSLIEGTVNDSLGTNITTLDSKEYQKIKHDIDSWNVNYFRNILHKNNVYDYPNQPRSTQPVNVDNNSLVYGKYFVIVFNFINNKQIKIEEIFISTSKY